MKHKKFDQKKFLSRTHSITNLFLSIQKILIISIVLATGVIRFLLRDAKETSKLAVSNDQILQQIVLNSNSIHSGLQCKFCFCLSEIEMIKK